MWKSSESETPEPAAANTIQTPAPSLAGTAGTSRPAPSATQNHSLIGKSIKIKGVIAASDPLYIYGSVEGSINAPAHRVTVGKDGKVKADISAREVVIMGDVHGNLEGGYRVEIRSDGSVTGDMAAHRVCIEDGAFLKGAIDVRQPSEKDKRAAQAEPAPAVETEETAVTAEPSLAAS